MVDTRDVATVACLALTEPGHAGSHYRAGGTARSRTPFQPLNGGSDMSENAGRTRATAVITVHKYEPSAYDEPAQGPVLTRIHVEESFSGDINGDGIVEFLQAALADGSASFVGIERVTGDLGGRRGTFLLQDAGTVQDNIVSGDWFVIAGSGTGQLAGLRGEGGFRAKLGESAQVHLDYWFE
jgi:hypothetical protein